MNKRSRKYVYSPFKVAFHQERLDALRNGDLPLPVLVQWDLTNRCNMDCVHCFYHIFELSDWNPKAEMPTNLVYRTLDELKELDVKAIEWTGGGSIECHPDYKEILRYSKKLGFENALVTNSTLLDEEALRIIRDFSWVRFSIDAATRETYRKVHRVDLFDKAVVNVKRLLDVRSERNVVGYSFIVSPANYTEIHTAAFFARNLGCDNVRFSLAMTPKREKLFDGIWDETVREIEKAKKLENGVFRVFAFSNRINELALKTLSDYCGYHHFVGVIAPTGVYPCCRLKDDGRFNLGKLGSQSFKEIWFGEKRRKFIKSISKGCKFDCWMYSKNKFIEYLLSENPMHKNFI